MQKQQNSTMGPLLHIAEEFMSYFVFLLHMVITAYLTLILYLATQPKEQGIVCLVAFFIDWNILVFLTMPLLKYVQRILEKPAGLLLLLVGAITIGLLLISTADENIVLSLWEGIEHYKPIFLWKLFS